VITSNKQCQNRQTPAPNATAFALINVLPQELFNNDINRVVKTGSILASITASSFIAHSEICVVVVGFLSWVLNSSVLCVAVLVR
jgi:hypothetical protein